MRVAGRRFDERNLVGDLMDTVRFSTAFLFMLER
jgi:hypothetical protein